MLKKPNEDLREYAKNKGVPNWRIASKMQISENTLLRYLNLRQDKEFSNKFKKTVDEIVESR